jgi:protein tyrosine phosphatase (PTP) superfamily phosphohydrolase (DUF442 family)
MTSVAQEAAEKSVPTVRACNEPPCAPAGCSRKGLAGSILKGLVAGLAVALLIEAYNVELGGNCHAILDGRAYRCAQPTAQQLEKMVRQHRIRTVINVRGNCMPMPWYRDECRVTSQLDVAMEDICLSAARLPSVSEIRRLIEVLDHCEYPVLFHCHRGADRTGIACAVLCLTRTNADLATCRHQLGLRYGHVALGKAGELDGFLDQYETWLQRNLLRHSPDLFRSWVENDYREYDAELELIRKPESVGINGAFSFEVRVRNTSSRAWRFQAGRTAGIHAIYMLHDDQNHMVLQDRAGLFDAVLEPGQSIDLTLPVPPLVHPGTYRLLVDMYDEQHCMFHQIGSEPLEYAFEVHP